jgi:plasmid rolling circle replication initiator protein Rep
VAKNMIGFMRASEVTVNSKDHSYNQHLHVLLCVESTYFKNQNNYIKQNEWTQFWKKAMKLNYTPVVNVQAIKPKKGEKSDIASAVDETAKYPVKSTDYMTDDQDRNLQVVKDLEEGLRQKRLISYGGLLKEIHKELHMDEVDDEETDLIHTTEEDEAEEIAYSITAIWNWQKKNYILK